MDTENMDHSAHQTKKRGLLSGKVLAICLGLLVVAGIALTVFKVSIVTIFFAGLLLLCPLAHVWMMRDGGHNH